MQFWDLLVLIGSFLSPTLRCHSLQKSRACQRTGMCVLLPKLSLTSKHSGTLPLAGRGNNKRKVSRLRLIDLRRRRAVVVAKSGNVNSARITQRCRSLAGVHCLQTGKERSSARVVRLYLGAKIGGINSEERERMQDSWSNRFSFNCTRNKQKS